MIKNEWFNWRCIGPFRGGRAVAVEGDPDNNLVFYQGSTCLLYTSDAADE